MSTWNYRIVRMKDRTHCLCEVYYNEKNEICDLLDNVRFVTDIDGNPKELIHAIEVALRDVKENEVINEPEEYTDFD